MHHVWGALCWSKHGEKQGDPPILSPHEVPQPGALPAQGLLGWNLTCWGPAGEPPQGARDTGREERAFFPPAEKMEKQPDPGSSPRAAAEPP